MAEDYHQERLLKAIKNYNDLKKINEPMWSAVGQFFNKVKEIQRSNPSASMESKMERLADLDIPDDLPTNSKKESLFTYRDLLDITYASIGAPQHEFIKRISTPPKRETATKRQRLSSPSTSNANGGGKKNPKSKKQSATETIYTGSKGGQYILVNGRRKYVSSLKN
jgi:hypothetical protein